MVSRFRGARFHMAFLCPASQALISYPSGDYVCTCPVPRAVHCRPISPGRPGSVPMSSHKSQPPVLVAGCLLFLVQVVFVGCGGGTQPRGTGKGGPETTSGS
jgi:hypothetical protein